MVRNAKVKREVNIYRNKIVTLIIVIFSVSIVSVFASYVGQNGTPSGTGSAGSCTNNICYQNIYFGLRLSVVNAAGQTIGTHEYIDLWGGKNATTSGYTYYTMPVKHARQNVVNADKVLAGFDPSGFGTWCTIGNRCYIVNQMEDGVQKSLWFEGIDANLIGGYGGNSNGPMQSAQAYVDYCTGVRLGYNSTREQTMAGCRANIGLYLKEWFGIDLAEYEDEYREKADPNKPNEIQRIPNSISDLFIQFEPLAMFTFQYGSELNGFYGTMTEMAYVKDAYWTWSIGGWGSLYDAPFSSKGCGPKINSNASFVSSDSSQNTLSKIYKSDNYTQNATCPTCSSGGSCRGTTLTQLQTKDYGAGIAQMYLGVLAQEDTNRKDCDFMLNYIKGKFTSGTLEFNQAIQQLRAGTFSYTDSATNKKYTIDGPQNYELLIPSNYNNPEKNTLGVGEPWCENVVPIPFVCDPDVNISECDENEEEPGKISFRDNNLERCWLEEKTAFTKDGTPYTSENTGHEAVSAHYIEPVVGNAQYCKVFCYEEIETVFPTKVFDVKAGQTFVWGEIDGKFGTIEIKKHCSTQDYVANTQGYLFPEWERDYKNNEKTMISNYLRWHFNEGSNDTISVTSSTNCSTCCLAWCSACDEDGCWDWCCSCGTLYTATKTSYSRGNSGNNSWLSVTGSSDGPYTASACSWGGAYYGVYVYTGSFQSAYSSAKANEIPLLDKIHQCTNDIKYIYEATLTFVFKEPENVAYGANTRSFGSTNNYKWEMVRDPDPQEGYNLSNVNTSECVRKTVYKYNDSGSKWGANQTPTAELVWDCHSGHATWDIEGKWEYSYPVQEFMWYSLKTDNTLLNKSEKESEYSHLDDAYFYSIGFGLPTAFSLTDGTYYMTMVVRNIGDNGAPLFPNIDRGHFWPLATDLAGLSQDDIGGVTEALGFDGYGLTYKCTYEVNNEVFAYECQYPAIADGETSAELTEDSPIYCDPTKDDHSNGRMEKVDIAYRLVQLLKPSDPISVAFPGRDGSGRVIGKNWNAIGEDRIRSILDIDIYNQSSAMYEIMLDVNAIHLIREDNSRYEDSGKDPYSSYFDYNNQLKVMCVKGSTEKDRYCASTFISWLNTSSRFNFPLLGNCLPPGDEIQRANTILADGCNVHYDYSSYYSTMWNR